MFEVYVAGAAVGAVALYGVAKGAAAAATSVGRKVSELKRDQGVKNEIAAHKEKQNQSAADRKEREKMLLSKKK
jgi:hypothetical protein